jgi:hypothetical protein
MNREGYSEGAQRSVPEKEKICNWADKPLIILIIILCFAAFLPMCALGAQNSIPSQKKYSSKELDALISDVLSRSELNLDALRDYVFNETETYYQQSNNERPIGFRCEYAWIVRDGYLVRSPVSINGVEVVGKEREASEEEWIKEQKEQGKIRNVWDYLVEFMRHYVSKSRVRMMTGGDKNPKGENLLTFKLKPGKYKYAGEQQYEGRKIVIVTYDDYPVKGRSGVVKNHVTMLVEPIVKQLIEIKCKCNVDTKTFVPIPSVKPCPVPEACTKVIDNFRLEQELSMNLHPIEGIWLPQKLRLDVKVDTQTQSGSSSYTREFHSYAKSDVKTKLLWFDAVD